MSKANLTVRNHEQNMSKQNKDLEARLSDVYDMLCEKYSIDLTHEAMAWSGQLPIEELKEERSRDLENSIECDAFDELHEMPPGHKAYDMVRVDEWRRNKTSGQYCGFGSSKLNNHAMTHLLEHLNFFF